MADRILKNERVQFMAILPDEYLTQKEEKKTELLWIVVSALGKSTTLTKS